MVGIAGTDKMFCKVLFTLHFIKCCNGEFRRIHLKKKASNNLNTIESLHRYVTLNQLIKIDLELNFWVQKCKKSLMKWKTLRDDQEK